MFKKAQAELAIVVIVVVIIVFLGWLVAIANRECNRNSDCSEDEYCGVDHGCHDIPVITKTETSVFRSYNLIVPSIIIGIALIITAIIFKWDKLKPKKQIESQKETQKTLQPASESEFFTNFPPATNMKK
ncbi:MAG: hypothetical protein UR15_C0038G0004 [Parcubacteria group bacterium GW2011_GWA2_31_28]|nr:MAG: hypothetical protein UR15_C0038G0004 [Parcubacteria group bacterium GW2011_GWA2_31_28]